MPKHPSRSVISVKLLCNFIEITLLHGCSPVNLLHIFRTYLRTTASEYVIKAWQYMSIYRLAFTCSSFFCSIQDS